MTYYFEGRDSLGMIDYTNVKTDNYETALFFARRDFYITGCDKKIRLVAVTK